MNCSYILTFAVVAILVIATLVLLLRLQFDPLLSIKGPPVRSWSGNHLKGVLDPSISPQVYQFYVSRYGRTIRIRGVGFWDNRLLTLDPSSVSYILKNTSIYQKPWQSRKLISNLIGCGLLAAEGQSHKRQRRVATPAFSVQSLQALVPLVFRKGIELKDKWNDIIDMQTNCAEVARVDVCHWISRATFDVIGIAAFDHDFHAMQEDSSELFSAYKDMFETSISRAQLSRTLISIYLPWLTALFPDEAARTIQNSRETIHRIAGQLVQAKKRKVLESKQSETSHDLLSLLLKSNAAEDLPSDQRISDEDILNNINTFMFAGSDTSSLALTWTLYLLAQNPDIQDQLHQELLGISPRTAADKLTDEEIHSLYDNISNLPYLHNVTRESLRLIPPVHSSIRVATQDDEIPTSYPVHRKDSSTEYKKSVAITKGTLIHIAIEGFNLDKDIWGDDAWDFNPERWDNLPEAVSSLPGIFANTLTFSAGPRSCIGMRFSLIEIKTFLYILLTNFKLKPTEEQIIKANVVLTRPYIVGRYREGSQCPLVVERRLAGKYRGRM